MLVNATPWGRLWWTLSGRSIDRGDHVALSYFCISEAELETLRYNNMMPVTSARDRRNRVLATNTHIARGGGSCARAAFQLYALGRSMVAIKWPPRRVRSGESKDVWLSNFQLRSGKGALDAAV